MLSLEVLLANAARSADWERAVVHRCAWCQRIATADGEYAEPPTLGDTTVVTDGMCPTCAAEALARLSKRLAGRTAAKPHP